MLGLTMGGVVLLTGLVLFYLTERQADKRAFELKTFQMENTRIIQQMGKSMDQMGRSMDQMGKSIDQMGRFMDQMEKNAALRHEENMTFFRGLGYSVARLIRNQGDDGA